MNRDDIEIDVLELLDLWWRYERRWLPVEGFPAECPSTSGWRASRQWDDQNGAFDGEAEAKLAQRVGQLVAQVEQPWLSALHMLARNRATGASVWRSPYVPTDADERAELVLQAVNRLRGLL